MTLIGGKVTVPKVMMVEDSGNLGMYGSLIRIFINRPITNS